MMLKTLFLSSLSVNALVKPLVLAYIFCFSGVYAQSSLTPSVSQGNSLPSVSARSNPIFSNNPALFSTPTSESTEPLPVEQAFVLTASRIDSRVTLNFKVAPGYYLYKEKIGIRSNSSANIALPNLPKGVVKYDETFAKNLETYRQQLIVDSIKTSASFKDGFNFDVHSQGCADLGICYPPQLQRVTFKPNETQGFVSVIDYVPMSLPVQLPNSSAVSETSRTSVIPESKQQAVELPKSPPKSQTAPVSEIARDSSRIQSLLDSNNKLWMAIAFVGFGLLLTFTPCVLPMVPIVSSIVLGKQHLNQHGIASDQLPTAWQGFCLTLAYVAGMVMVYTAIGVLAGLAGAGLSTYLQHPVLIACFAGLMVVLAGAQFGWFRLSMPHSWSLLQLSSNGQGSVKRYSILMGMGALSAVMVGPCVTAPLAGVLAFISQTGNAWTGATALFSLALGMGIPLLLIGAGGAKFLPKTGAWMNDMSYSFGIMLLAVAVWMLQSLLPSEILTTLWLGILLLIAEWLGAFHPLSSFTSRLLRLKAGLAYVCALWAAATVLGMAAGKFDVLSPLSSLKISSQNVINKGEAKFQWVPSQSLEAALLQSQGKPILLDLYADWCVSCIEFEKFTFTDPAVSNAMAQFHLIKVDVTHNTLDDQALLKKLKLFGPPGIVFYNAKAQEMVVMRFIGFKAAPPFFQHLNQVLEINR